jgi:hypothetical protein
VKLPEADSKKGFILLSYDQPAPPPSKQRTRILAFLKETEKGVKLDWEVYVQTKYRLFANFTKVPAAGKSDVFRVIVAKNPAPAGGDAKSTISYQFRDPAHSADMAEIEVDPKSEAGIALAGLFPDTTKPGEAASRTATVELAWSDEATHPKLQVKRFICAEFLGLGGKEAGAPSPE